MDDEPSGFGVRADYLGNNEAQMRYDNFQSPQNRYTRTRQNKDEKEEAYNQPGEIDDILNGAQETLNEFYEDAKSNISGAVGVLTNRLNQTIDENPKLKEKYENVKEVSGNGYSISKEIAENAYSGVRDDLNIKYEGLSNTLNNFHQQVDSCFEPLQNLGEEYKEKAQDKMEDLERSVDQGADRILQKAADILHVDKQVLIDKGEKIAVGANKLFFTPTVYRGLGVLGSAATLSPVMIAFSSAGALLGSAVDTFRVGSLRNTKREHNLLVRYRNAKTYEQSISKLYPEMAAALSDIIDGPDGEYKIDTKKISPQAALEKDLPKLDKDELNHPKYKERFSTEGAILAVFQQAQRIGEAAYSFLTRPTVADGMNVTRHVSSIQDMYHYEKEFINLGNKMKDTIKLEKERDGAVKYDNIEELATATRNQRIKTLALKETMRELEISANIKGSPKSQEEIRVIYQKNLAAINLTEDKIKKSQGIIANSKRAAKTVFKAFNPFSKYADLNHLSSKVEILADHEKYMQPAKIRQPKGKISDDIDFHKEVDLQIDRAQMINSEIENIRKSSREQFLEARNIVDHAFDEASAKFDKTEEKLLKQAEKVTGYKKGSKQYKQIQETCKKILDNKAAPMEPKRDSIMEELDAKENNIEADIKKLKKQAKNSSLDKIGTELKRFGYRIDNAINGSLDRVDRFLGHNRVDRALETIDKSVSNTFTILSSNQGFRLLAVVGSSIVASPALFGIAVVGGAIGTATDVYRTFSLRDERKEHNMLVDFRNSKNHEEELKRDHKTIFNICSEAISETKVNTIHNKKAIPIDPPTSKNKFSISTAIKGVLGAAHSIGMAVFNIVRKRNLSNILVLARSAALARDMYDLEKSFAEMKEDMKYTIKLEHNRAGEVVDYKNIQELAENTRKQQINTQAIDATIKEAKEKKIPLENKEEIQKLFQEKLKEFDDNTKKVKNYRGIVYTVKQPFKTIFKSLNPLSKYSDPRKFRGRVRNIIPVSPPEYQTRKRTRRNSIDLGELSKESEVKKIEDMVKENGVEKIEDMIKDKSDLAKLREIQKNVEKSDNKIKNSSPRSSNKLPQNQKSLG